jgi:tRNA 5-methylaminomethyl-2-thiouridine biosynthesis bifunctional protein
VHPPALCHGRPAIRDSTARASRCAGTAQGRWQWQAWDGEHCWPARRGGAGRRCRDRFRACAELPLKRIRGQITRLPQTAAKAALRTVVCAEGYVAPARLGEHTLGASFDFKSEDLTPTTAEHRATWRCSKRSPPTLARVCTSTNWPGNPGRARRLSLHQPRLSADRRALADQRGLAQAYAA